MHPTFRSMPIGHVEARVLALDPAPDLEESSGPIEMRHGEDDPMRMRRVVEGMHVMVHLSCWFVVIALVIEQEKKLEMAWLTVSF